MTAVFDQIARHRLVPVIVLQNAEYAAPLAEALVTGGLPCAEVTFRTTAAAAGIRAMAERGDMLVGAGTVLKVDQVKQAVDNGARFIVSPGFQPKVVAYCVENHIPVAPGVCTPTDIGMALEHELTVLKFFPAEAAGGVKMLQAISAPYGNALRFIPTGGISEANLAPYLSFGKVIAVGGSWMVPDDLIQTGQFDAVRTLVRQAVELVAPFATPAR